MENRNEEIRLDGRWRVVRKFIDGDPAGQRLTMYEDFFVEFVADNRLVETHGNEATKTYYRFDADSCTIEFISADCIQPSSIFCNTIFHIVSLNDCEMYLRKPHSIEVDGESGIILLSSHATL